MRDPESAAHRRRVVRLELPPSTIITVLLVVAGLWLMTRLLPVILMLIAALIVVGTLSPAVQWLETRRLRRGLSIAAVFTGLLIVTLALITLTIPPLLAQVTSIIKQGPELREHILTYLSRPSLTAPFAETLRTIRLEPLLQPFGAMALALSTRLFEVVAYGVGAVFLALYMLIDRDRVRGALFAIMPRSSHIRLSRVMLNLETIVGGYIRGQIITCALMTAFLFILLLACGVPNALAIAVFGGIADVLPYIGIFLTMGPAVLAAMSQGVVVTVIVFSMMLVYEELESRLLVPVVYGRAMRLPSSLVLFSFATGATLLGIVGALLSLPVAAALLMLIKELRVELPGETEGVASAELRREDVQGEHEYERRTEGMPAEQAAAVAVKISADRKKENSDGAA